MLILSIIVFVAFLALALLTFPWRLFRVASSNARRGNGSVSRKRAAIELRRGVGFMGEVLLVPILATTLLTGACFLVDRYLIPLPLLRDVVSLFDLRFSVWDENMESGRFGDVGLTYGEWAQSRGYSANTGFTIRKFLKNNWLALVILSAGLAFFVYWFVIRYYLSALVEYNKELYQRREKYRVLDVIRAVEESEAVRQ